MGLFPWSQYNADVYVELYLHVPYTFHGLVFIGYSSYGCETWSLTLREERRLRVFENRVLRGLFGPKKDEVTGNGENYIMRSLGIFTPYPILCGW